MAATADQFGDMIGYAIKIGEAFEVRIVNVRGGQTRVGIDEPFDLSADRQRISEQIRAAKESVARRAAD